MKSAHFQWNTTKPLLHALAAYKFCPARFSSSLPIASSLSSAHFWPLSQCLSRYRMNCYAFDFVIWSSYISKLMMDGSNTLARCRCGYSHPVTYRRLLVFAVPIYLCIMQHWAISIPTALPFDRYNCHLELYSLFICVVLQFEIYLWCYLAVYRLLMRWEKGTNSVVSLSSWHPLNLTTHFSNRLQRQWMYEACSQRHHNSSEYPFVNRDINAGFSRTCT